MPKRANHQSSIFQSPIEVSEEKKFDLDERTFQFALAVRKLIGAHRWSLEQTSDVKQVLRSSGSVAANYAEANNPISTGDFLHRLKVCRKESGESRLWLRLLGETSVDDRRNVLRTLWQESDELTRIFTSILKKNGEE
ncbi:four helix bundle protein [Luteolibacter arcticus]|uniref:four helix bundle protein n=1 Tax=Luteolibacter arcticus TaxID=1581411 RepID=UPI0022238B46|nr:four helix bundle protein [Luteolibacter arcticus]